MQINCSSVLQTCFSDLYFYFLTYILKKSILEYAKHLVLPSIYKYLTKIAIDKYLYCYAFIRILSRYRKCNVYGLFFQGTRGVNHVHQREEGEFKTMPG